MKKSIRRLLIQLIVAVAVYQVLLRALAGTNIVAGLFCPGPHLPAYHRPLIVLFVLLRFYVLLLPGIVLSRVALAWLKRRPTKS